MRPPGNHTRVHADVHIYEYSICTCICVHVCTVVYMYIIVVTTPVILPFPCSLPSFLRTRLILHCLLPPLPGSTSPPHLPPSLHTLSPLLTSLLIIFNLHFPHLTSPQHCHTPRPPLSPPPSQPSTLPPPSTSLSTTPHSIRSRLQLFLLTLSPLLCPSPLRLPHSLPLLHPSPTHPQPSPPPHHLLDHR